MEKTTFKGIVSAVASNGSGVKIGNVWYNAVGNAKKYIDKDKLMWKNVELSICNTEKREFNFIKVFLGGNKTGGMEGEAPGLDPSKQDQMQPKNFLSKDDFWQNKEKRDIITSKRISRHGAINSAIELLKVTSTKNIDNDVFKRLEVYADKILEYVNKE